MASIDVVIPNYNYARFLPQCVSSVLSQDVEELRVLIIDNASSDASAEVARDLARKDSRIEVVCEPTNRGPHASFNKGIDWASADLLVILCSDDLLAEGALKRASRALERCEDAVFALGANAKLVGDARKTAAPASGAWRAVSGDDFIAASCRSLGFSLALGAMVVRTAVQKAVGHYRPSLPYTDDFEMALRLAARGAVVEFDAALGIRREHAGQMSEARFADERTRLREREAAFRSFFSTEAAGLARRNEFEHTARRRLAETALWSTVSHLRRGRVRSAAGLFGYGMALNPAAIAAIPPEAMRRLRGARLRARTSALS